MSGAEARVCASRQRPPPGPVQPCLETEATWKTASRVPAPSSAAPHRSRSAALPERTQEKSGLDWSSVIGGFSWSDHRTAHIRETEARRSRSGRARHREDLAEPDQQVRSALRQVVAHIGEPGLVTTKERFDVRLILGAKRE